MSDDKPQRGQDLPHFHYIKSQHFRVIHVDGAQGGISPEGNIQMSLYSQRFPIPQETALVASGGSLLTEQVVTSKSGIVREVEVHAVMDLPTAEAIHNWLGQRIKSLRSYLDQPGAVARPDVAEPSK